MENKCETDDKEENNSFVDDDSFDKPFTKAAKRSKKQFQTVEEHMNSSDCLPPRRSARKRRYRDEKMFTISSQQTLKDLKVMIMSEFKVATYDQHLYLNDSPLEGNEQTLASLNVEPNSLIYLRSRD
ncbi:ubiquitin carboxyl-terminal hydrolase 48-like protein [Leptotrombidium deliense]|uniref:Ubiquitin carboxyl-terminal hydrolase 48-like protein n=1 Tax=Leptotrombidium deliense TaxID=299467 RepID=A0A443SW78_9ACAR|nr:ubiquitin carboxyl-terminal hydrolase 48-like protein [Leptotrombidium deliense]